MRKHRRKMLPRFVAVLLSLAMVLGLTGGVTVIKAEEVIATGDCGTNVTWQITQLVDNTYKLTIASTAADNLMKDYGTPTGKTAVPWSEYLTLISDLEVKSGVVHLGARTCYGATGLKSISIPKTVTSTGNGVFRGCTSLKYANMPGAITSMVDNLFYGCTALEEVVLGEGTTVAGRNMVNGGCTSLKTLTLPGSVTLVNETAFQGTALTTIHYSSTIANYKIFLATNDYTEPLKTDTISVECTNGTYLYGHDSDLPVEGATSGRTGDVEWAYDGEAKALAITGNGAMANYTRPNGADTPIRYCEIKSSRLLYFKQRRMDECNACTDCISRRH